MSDTLSKPEHALSAPFPWQLSQWAQLSRSLANNQLAHAYLISGSLGLGKALFTNSFARYVLCSNPVTSSATSDLAETSLACNSCPNCLQSVVGSHPDILLIEPEEGSKNIKIDQIRLLSEFVIRSSHAGGAKIAIIQNAHLLNANAANALLKTLEEPNKATHVFLVSDFPGRLVATIRSRCQKIAFQIPNTNLVTPWLQSIIGAGNVESILEASEMRPLIALQLIEGDSLQKREQFIQGFCDIKTGRKSIQQVLSLIAKDEESEVLQHFSTFLSKLTKYSLTGFIENADDHSLQEKCGLLLASEGKSPKKIQSIASSLALLYNSVETARRQLASSTNPNPQLLMESVLWQWSELNLH